MMSPLPVCTVVVLLLNCVAAYNHPRYHRSTYRNVVDSRLPSLLSRGKDNGNRQHISALATTSGTTGDYTTCRKEQQEVPSVNVLFKFGLPTLGIWLLQPILSLVDTSVIGMNTASRSNVLQLAGLASGIAWVDSTAYMCQFVGMATTNLYATAISEGDRPKQRKVLSHATIIAFALGILLFAIQYTLAPMMMKILAGSAVDSIPYALKYSKIRSFGALVAVPTIIGQAAFLASKDSVTPLKAVLVGSVLNIVGDVVLVRYCGQGIAGAAWATVASQLGSALYLLVAGLFSRKLGSNADDESSSSGGGSSSSSSSSISSSVDSGSDVGGSSDSGSVSASSSAEKAENDGSIDATTTSQQETPFQRILYRIQRAKKATAIPGMADLQTFLSFCGPLFFVLLIKSFLWSFTTYACSTAGAANLAAHQIVLNIFCIFAIFGDAVSQMSQTYLPEYFGSKQTTRQQFANGLLCIQRIVKISFFTGLINCVLAFLAVNKFGHKLFTKSVEVNAAMASIVMFLSLSVFPNTLMASLEGVLIATRDVTFHWITYLITGVIMVSYQSAVHANGLGLMSVWRGIVAFQWLRVAIFTSRVLRVLSIKQKNCV